MVLLGIMGQLIIQLQIISMESPSQNNHQIKANSISQSLT
jgi:hypothetical protein